MPINGHVSLGLFKVSEKKETVVPTVADDGEVQCLARAVMIFLHWPPEQYVRGLLSTEPQGTAWYGTGTL